MLVRASAVVLVALSFACAGGQSGSYMSSDDDDGWDGPPGGGVDTGGAQDIAYARELIANGQVPNADDIPIEGLLSEHDLPTEGNACEEILCIRPSSGIAPSLTLGGDARWVQLGMLTALPPATFQRPPIDLVVAIDKSGSMSIDIAEVRIAVKKLIDQVRPHDRLAILAFDSERELLHPLAAVTDKAALKAAVDGIGAEGSWHFQPAMIEAYGLHEAAGDDPARLRRVIVMTCGYPGVDGQDPFSVLVKNGATRRVGMSMIGVILGWDPAMAAMLGETRGANYYYLQSLESVEQVFDTDLDNLLTPLAYDLELAFEVGAGWEIERLIGFPGNPGDPSVRAEIATAFRSNRRGATFLRLTEVPGEYGPEHDELGAVRFTYLPESALGFGADTLTDSVALPGFPAETPVGVRKGAFLVNQAERMQAACVAYHANDAALAITLLDELLAYMESEAAALADPALAPEITLVQQLRTNAGG